MIENKSGHQLLEFINGDENSAQEKYKPITGAFAFISCENKYLICYNKWRNQWEFPAGRLEPGETMKEAAKRELYEETGQAVNDLTFRGLFKIYDKGKDEIRYRAAYTGALHQLSAFIDNEETTKIMLWDLIEDIGEFDSVDKAMFLHVKKST